MAEKLDSGISPSRINVKRCEVMLCLVDKRQTVTDTHIHNRGSVLPASKSQVVLGQAVTRRLRHIQQTHVVKFQLFRKKRTGLCDSQKTRSGMVIL